MSYDENSRHLLFHIPSQKNDTVLLIIYRKSREVTMTESFNQICHRLRSNAADLTILNLNYRDIGNRGAILLADALRTNRTLVVLFLECNSIGDIGACHLAHSAAHHPHLQHLYLSHNRIGDNGACAWGEALSGVSGIDGGLGGSQLRVLKLAHNHIGSRGAAALGEALRRNCRLRTLVLDSNPSLGAAGVSFLAEGLKCNESLTAIDLSHCCDASTTNLRGKTPEQQAMRALLSALETNRTLKELVMSQCLSTGRALSHAEGQLSLLVRLNRLGRRHHGSTSIAPAAWPRLLATATLLDSQATPDALSQRPPCTLYAVLRARPDLLGEVRS